MPNYYKVPKKQWKKWNEQARNVFNEVYYTLRNNKQAFFLHPKTKPVPKEQWNTTAWNAAWIAADAAN